MSEQDRSPPESFGIEAATRKILDAYDHTFLQIRREMAAGFGRLQEQLDIVLSDIHRIEGNSLKIMVTIQNLSDAIDQQGEIIQQEAQEVKAALDAQMAIINDLRGQVNPDVQPLVDKLEENNNKVRAIFTGDQTPPAARRK